MNFSLLFNRMAIVRSNLILDRVDRSNSIQDRGGFTNFFVSVKYLGEPPLQQ
ncbi:MAG: hypothetical protein HC786_08225 [Richelia sp. CSU_2_1]|nr:hypothetical protein [Richelia sp. CSU_2_1]